MGGRRPTKIRTIAGTGENVTKFTRDLTNAIKKKDAEKTLDVAFKIASTEKSLENLAHAMSLLKPLHNKLKEIESKKINFTEKERHAIAVKEWSKIEKERKLTLDSGFRRMIIESAEKSLKGDKKWKTK